MRTKEALYFLESDTLKTLYKKNGMDYANYEERLHYLQNLASQNGYEVHNIDADALRGIKKNALVIALDMMALSDHEISDIDTFVKNGGRLLFNFTSGFLDKNLKYRKNNLVYTITGMELNNKINTIKLNKKAVPFLTVRLSSPLAIYLPDGWGMDMSLYDPLPVFKTNKDLVADAYLTNWSQTNYISLSKEKTLNAQESALIWHGSKGRGKWVYFSFPSYIFMNGEQKLYTKLFKGMLAYLHNMTTVVPYPYIDAKNVVFVEEDTEYRYENLLHFTNVSKKHKFPVTAFCVARLAKKHTALMKEVGKSPYLEIGSHSYSHDKIVGQSDAVYEKETQGSKELLEALTSKPVIGFRPPREEIDKKLFAYLSQAGYKYVLNEGENRLTAYFKDSMLIIPRHATDDYSYLINLDWSSKQILTNMIKELHTVVNLDGMYTLSVHTHLMSFGSNIVILDKFFAYVKKHKEFHPMNGEMIYKRAVEKRDLHIEQELTQKKIILTITNENKHVIRNLKYEISVDPTVTLHGVESEIIGFKATLKKEKPFRYLLDIRELKPKSKIRIFINYDKTL